jgi:hypothetical protein
VTDGHADPVVGSTSCWQPFYRLMDAPRLAGSCYQVFLLTNPLLFFGVKTGMKTAMRGFEGVQRGDTKYSTKCPQVRPGTGQRLPSWQLRS